MYTWRLRRVFEDKSRAAGKSPSEEDKEHTPILTGPVLYSGVTLSTFGDLLFFAVCVDPCASDLCKSLMKHKGKREKCHADSLFGSCGNLVLF